jgi:hypothetical protein
MFPILHFSISALPKSPFSPPSRPAQRLFLGHPAKSKFLAAGFDSGQRFPPDKPLALVLE